MPWHVSRSSDARAGSFDSGEESLASSSTMGLKTAGIVSTGMTLFIMPIGREYVKFSVVLRTTHKMMINANASFQKENTREG